MFESILASLPAALMIFGLRICDVSVGTVRMMYTLRGNRPVSLVLGFVESSIFIFAVSGVLSGPRDPVKMLAYAAGFATGTLVGVTIEGLIASGWVLMRVISRHRSDEITAQLRAVDFGGTRVRGEGREGEVSILFVVLPRRRAKTAVQIIQSTDPEAFVTFEPVNRAIGGYMTPRSAAAVVGK